MRRIRRLTLSACCVAPGVGSRLGANEVPGGKNWELQEVVYEEGGEKPVTIGNPCPVVDHETGTIWLPFRRNNSTVLITSSADEGKNWPVSREVYAGSAAGSCLARIANGRLAVLFERDDYKNITFTEFALQNGSR